VVEFTPLIDCAFILIIFFAATTTMIKARTGVDLNLPEKTEVQQLPQHIQISVKKGDPEFHVFFEDLQVTPEALAEMVRSKMEEDPQSAFILAAEPNVVYDNVIEIIDIVNEAGGKNLALQLKEKSHGKKQEEKPK